MEPSKLKYRIHSDYIPEFHIFYMLSGGDSGPAMSSDALRVTFTHKREYFLQAEPNKVSISLFCATYTV